MTRAIRFLIMPFFFAALATGHLVLQDDEKSTGLVFKGMAFKSGVRIGKPQKETCTERCHIDYPFGDTKVFRHTIHSTENGFSCDLCHVSDPLPAETHGKNRLAKGGCRKCHHDPERFSSCSTCHFPVDRLATHLGLPFDHKKHTSGSTPPPCVQCHSGKVNLTKTVESLDCLSCHHAKTHPTNCRTCHEAALESRLSETFKGFDHGLHAGSTHLENACRFCHLSGKKITTVPPVSCTACHHPTDPSRGLDCTICHTDAEIRPGIRNPKYDHALHVQAGYPCMNCHGLDALRSPDAGKACGRCHHLQRDGCRTCHGSKLFFEQTYRNGSVELTFLHASHETDHNCSQCHPAGADIRSASKALNCVDCHHHTGAGPSCEACHPEIEGIRAGRLPSGGEGKAEVMNGIVSCRDCHGFDASAHHALANGSNSCTRCHPEEYLALSADMRRVLENAFKAVNGKEGMEAPPYTLRQGLHNFRLILSDLKRRAAEGPTRTTSSSAE